MNPHTEVLDSKSSASTSSATFASLGGEIYPPVGVGSIYEVLFGNFGRKNREEPWFSTAEAKKLSYSGILALQFEQVNSACQIVDRNDDSVCRAFR